MKFRIILILLNTLLISGVVSRKDTCDEPGGCFEDDEEDRHNVWTAEVHEESEAGSENVDESVMEYFKDNGISLTKWELELLLNHLDGNNDGKVDVEDLNGFQFYTDDPLKVVENVLQSFNRIDADDNGVLSQWEFRFLSKPDATVSIREYMKIISKLDSNVKDTLQPFDSMSHMPAAELKMLIGRTLGAFKLRDVDGSGSLNMEEYAKPLAPPPPGQKAPGKTKEERASIFKLVDKDEDGEISFLEFVNMIPKAEAQMSQGMNAIFDSGDEDKDGYWTLEEFDAHIQRMVKESDAPAPQLGETLQAFEQLDKDGDGRLSREELKLVRNEAQKIMQTGATQGFMSLDTNQDGVLSKDELAKMVPAMEKAAGQKVDVEQLIMFLDKNRNGAVEMEEIAEMAKQMEAMMQSQMGMGAL